MKDDWERIDVKNPGEPDVNVGDLVRLTGDHPYCGELATVARFATWRGKPSFVVALKRGDALDGHECGITDASQYEVLKPVKRKRRK